MLIAKKRDGGELSPGEIGDFIDGFARGTIADYQMAAMAMAIYLRGMTLAETVALVEAMLRSGSTLAWSSPLPPRVDKHSTGGIGDKTSLVLAPLLACCGVQVPMISGRGLGATGGTLDKLESIPGFRTDLSLAEIQRLTEQVGCVITGATADLVPADRKLYALRDVTATVPSIPLITASILSKKLAEGLAALVLDVKFGSGAFMKTLDEGRALARPLVAVSQGFGLKAAALLTDMHQPLGRLAGNAVEVNEAVEALQGGGPDDLRQLCLALGAEALVLAGVEPDHAPATARLSAALQRGEALQRFRRMVAAQGGDLDAPRTVAPPHEVAAAQGGYVHQIDGQMLGEAIIASGGGRKRLGEPIDHSMGFEMLVRRGDEVERGQPLVRLFASHSGRAEAVALAAAAFTIGPEPPADVPLIAEKVA